MSQSVTPDLSIVLVTPGPVGDLGRTIRHLLAQTALDRIELILVAPPGVVPGELAGELAGFPRYRIIERDFILLTEARAAGALAATAPAVAFGEDHAYPDPGWAEAIIDAFRQPYAAVAGAMRNANPESAVSQADFLLNFGRWAALRVAGAVDGGPWHNTSYRTEVLREFGPSLNSFLMTEGVLFAELRARGQRIYYEPRATLRHVNVSRVAPFLSSLFMGRRAYANVRADYERWSRTRRLSYLLAWPLLYLTIYRQAFQDMRRCVNDTKSWARILSALVPAVLMCTLGETAGYLFGDGGAQGGKNSIEYDRLRFVTSRDRILLAEAESRGPLSSGPLSMGRA